MKHHKSKFRSLPSSYSYIFLPSQSRFNLKMRNYKTHKPTMSRQDQRAHIDYILINSLMFIVFVFKQFDWCTQKNIIFVGRCKTL